MLWRILIALVAVLLTWALLPPIARILTFPLSGDVLLVIRIVVAGLAIFYVLAGKTPTLPA